jgi:hypothetical protein
MLDIALDQTFDVKFNTRTSASPPVPITFAGSPAVEVYEDNSTTQITGAVTLTVDFDGVTGLHNMRIAATTANGFEVGKSYSVVVSAGTVDGNSVVGETLFQFTVKRSAVNATADAVKTKTDQLTFVGDSVNANAKYWDEMLISSTSPFSGVASNTDMATVLSRISAARAGYLDNLNVGGVVASQADINALNQSASRRVILTTVPQYEVPESGTTVYTIESRTYDEDGAAVNADSTPTLTITGATSGDLSANLSAASNPATGVYRWTYTVTAGDTTEPVLIEVSSVINTSTFTIAAHTQITDFVSTTFTVTDQNNLTAIFNKLPSVSTLLGSANADGSGYATPANVTSAQSAIIAAQSTNAETGATAALDAISATALARFVTVDTTESVAMTGSVAKLSQGAGGGGGPVGPGADQVTITISDDGVPIENANVWISTDAGGAAVIAGTLTTNALGQVTFLLTDGATYYLWAQKAGMKSIQGQLFTASGD